MGNLRLRPVRLGSGSGLTGGGPGAGVEPGVADEAALKAIPPGDRDDRDVCFVESPADWWQFDAQSIVAVGANVLAPNDITPPAPGRWLRTPLTADIKAALAAAPTALTSANPAISVAEKTALDTAVAARVVGPAASVDNALMVYDGILGKTAKCGLAAVAPTVDPVTGSIVLPTAGATVDGVDVSAHAAATTLVHGGDAAGKYPSTPALAAADAAGTAAAAVGAHAALTSHLTPDERAGVDAALGGALTAANPPLTKAARMRHLLAQWSGGISVVSLSNNPWTDPGIGNAYLDGAALDKAQYNYHVVCASFLVADATSAGLMLRYVKTDGSGPAGNELGRVISGDALQAWGKTTDGGATFPTWAADTANVNDNNVATLAEIGALDTLANGNYILVGLNTDPMFTNRPFCMLGVKLNANVNTNASVLSVDYWNGAWAPVAGLVDGTASAGKTFGKSGVIRWTDPVGHVAHTPFAGGPTTQWIRLSVSAALSGPNVQVVAAQAGPDEFRFRTNLPASKARSARGAAIPEAAIDALVAAGIVTIQPQGHSDGDKTFYWYSWCLEAVPK